MQFIKDDRVDIIEPLDRSNATLPVTVRWDVREFEVTGRDGQNRSDSGYFAVFVDRSTVQPGETLEWLALQDKSCGSAACGTVENLVDVYATDETSLELTSLPAIRATGGRELHTVRIVLLDGTGARIGETAFRVQFYIEREE